MKYGADLVRPGMTKLHMIYVFRYHTQMKWKDFYFIRPTAQLFSNVLRTPNQALRTLLSPKNSANWDRVACQEFPHAHSPLAFQLDLLNEETILSCPHLNEIGPCP